MALSTRVAIAVAIAVIVVIAVSVAIFVKGFPKTSTTTSTSSVTVSTTSSMSVSRTSAHSVAHTCREHVTLVILTRHPTEVLQRARQLFLNSSIAKRFCITDLKFVKIPAGWWVEYVKSHSVDVAWGGGPTLFDILLSAHLLRPLQTKVALDALKQIPNTIGGVPTKKVVNGKVYWVAAALASFGFTVNTKVAKQLGFDWKELKTWRDLASDELGLLMLKTGVPVVGIADPTMSTSMTRMYEIILQAYGWDEGWRILTLLAANSRIYRHSHDVRDAVINGEIMVGLTIDFYGYTAHVLNPACRYILPVGETIVNGDPIAVTVSTKHPEAAEAFVAWVLTQGQVIWLDKHINRLPVNPRVFETPEGKARKDLYEIFNITLHAKTINFNETLADETERAVVLYFKATLIDLHDLLQKAWTALLKAYYVDHSISKSRFEELKNLLTSFPTFVDPITGKKTVFSVKYAILATKEIEKNPKIVDKLVSAWREAARAKYLEVLKELGAG